MPEITLEVRGGDFIEQGFQQLQREIPNAMREQIGRSAYLIGAHFKVYPAKPTGSTYIRTGKLADSIRLRYGTNGTTISIDPVSPKGRHYGTYVIGDAAGIGQAQVNRHWPLLKAVADKVTSTMTGELESALKEKIRQAGL